MILSSGGKKSDDFSKIWIEYKHCLVSPCFHPYYLDIVTLNMTTKKTYHSNNRHKQEFVRRLLPSENTHPDHKYAVKDIKAAIHNAMASTGGLRTFDDMVDFDDSLRVELDQMIISVKKYIRKDIYGVIYGDLIDECYKGHEEGDIGMCSCLMGLNKEIIGIAEKFINTDILITYTNLASEKNWEAFRQFIRDELDFDSYKADNDDVKKKNECKTSDSTSTKKAKTPILNVKRIPNMPTRFLICGSRIVITQTPEGVVIAIGGLEEDGETLRPLTEDERTFSLRMSLCLPMTENDIKKHEPNERSSCNLHKEVTHEMLGIDQEPGAPILPRV